MVTNEMGFTTMANINIILHHGKVGGDNTLQNLTGEKDLLEMKVWGNLLLMKGAKLIVNLIKSSTVRFLQDMILK